jgi:cell division protein FtsI (penicillin-binding protein 3)
MIMKPAGDLRAVTPQVRLQRRILTVKIGLLISFAVLAGRLVQIQVVQAGAYQELARRQYEAPMKLPAARGIILDRNGKVLVSNTVFASFAADPKEAGRERNDIAVTFAQVFNRPREVYLTRLRDQDKRFVWLERGVPPALSARIPVRDLQGIITIPEAERLYHYEQMAGQLLGHTGVDHSGLSGLELQYDRWLRGNDGYVIMQRDALRRTRLSPEYPRVEPVDGQNIYLTIDAEVQAIVEEELAKGVARTKAESGLAVMVDPATGAVLAMANFPSFYPARAALLSPAVQRNRVITDSFEPGSVFKVVTASAALETGAVRPEEKIFAENGRYFVPVPGRKPRKIDDTHRHGMLTFQEGMEQSSNIVMAKVATRVGTQTMFTTARAFGFGIETDLGLPGEISGNLKKPAQWSATTLHSLAMGYEVAVTPMQLVMAYAAVANGGWLMKPFVVRQVVNAQQDVLLETEQQQIRRVISDSTARVLTRFFEGVVERGTGTAARVPGLRIAGKTGTSKKVLNGQYVQGDYTASFVGFFPAEAPKYVCLVMLDNPRSGGYYGGLASAPIFKGIAEKVFAIADRTTGSQQHPAMAAGTNRRLAPDVVNVKVDVASALLESQGYKADVSGSGAVVLSQSPPPGTTVASGSTVTLRTDDRAISLPAGYTLVPELRGLSMRRAINRLTNHRLDVSVAGSGTVTGQNPAPGERVRQGTLISLRCAPRSAMATSL